MPVLWTDIGRFRDSRDAVRLEVLETYLECFQSLPISVELTDNEPAHHLSSRLGLVSALELNFSPGDRFDEMVASSPIQPPSCRS